MLNCNVPVIVAMICFLVKNANSFPTPQHNEHEIVKVNGHIMPNTRFVYGPEEAPLEKEGIPSAILTKYENTQQAAGGIVHVSK